MEYAADGRRWWRAGWIAVLAVALLMAWNGTARATQPETVEFQIPVGGDCPEGLAYDGVLDVKIIASYGDDGFREVWKVDGTLTVTAPEDREGETYRIHHRFTVKTVQGAVYGSGLTFGLFDSQGRPVRLDAGRANLAMEGFDPHVATCEAIAG